MILSSFKENSSKKQIERKNFTLLKQIGSGNFGSVHTATLHDESGETFDQLIAVKTISGFGTEKGMSDFLNEIKIMGELNPHINLVSMIGSCTTELEKENKLWLLIEYCKHGDLKRYIMEHRDSLLKDDPTHVIHNRLLLLWSYDIAKRNAIFG